MTLSTPKLNRYSAKRKRIESGLLTLHLSLSNGTTLCVWSHHSFCPFYTHSESFCKTDKTLKNRKVTASLLIQKMGTYSRASRLRAIREIGRIFKTLYILEYIDNPQLRGEVRLHLTRHESKNTLARYLFLGEEGELRRRDYDSQMERMSCLSLLMNCIVAWNTHYISCAIEQLRSEGNQIDSSLIAHITPLMHAHINPYGVYYFNVEET